MSQKKGHQVGLFLMKLCEKVVMGRYFLMQVVGKNLAMSERKGLQISFEEVV